MFRILPTSVAVPIMLTLILGAGCGRTPEERARLEAACASLHGIWQGGSHTFVFRADGTFEHEENLDDSVVMQTLRIRQGRWEVDSEVGGTLRVSLICKSKDCQGYWVQKDAEATNTWTVLFRVENDRLQYCDDAWNEGSWSELTRVGEIP